MVKKAAWLGRGPAFSGVLTAVLATVLVAGGCSSDDEGEPTPTDSTGSASGGEAVPLQVTVGKVNGRIKAKDATAVATRVGSVVDGWWQAAYVGGKWPRTDFAHAFPGFTQGAAADAKKDVALMTNQTIGGQVSTVTAQVRKIVVDLLAANQHAAAATARFTLVFSTTGKFAKQVTVQGQAFLTKGKEGNWKVFGYNVTRSSK
jgi:outer membrane murein-binding lipoprotein Lpp